MGFRQYISEQTGEAKSNYFLNELKFSEKNLEKSVKLFSSIFGKKLGGNFRIMGLEDYKRKMGPGKGYRVMNNEGRMLRFNWDEKLSKSVKYELTSVDYWDKGNLNFQLPTRTVFFGGEFNVIQVIDNVVDALVTGTIEEAKSSLAEDTNLLLEARTSEEKRNWLESKGLAKSFAKSTPVMKKKAVEAGYGEELEEFLAGGMTVQNGSAETNSFENSIKAMEKTFDKEVFADPETVFEDIEDLLSVVAAGKWRTLIVCGMGGVGKTYHITEGPRSLKALLGPEGDKWTYHSGAKAAPQAFYTTLFSERHKIIVFDEADSILKNDVIIMMLKPILDTSGSNMAEYMAGTQNVVGMSEDEIKDYEDYVDTEIAAGTEVGPGKGKVKLPSKFYFTGGMIFISNMRANQIEGAIMSRSLFVDVYLAQQDVLKRINSIAIAQYGEDRAALLMEGLGESSSGASSQEITYMTPEFARKTKPFTVRTMAIANILEGSGLARWSELARLYA